jgi:sulfide dehydrogenase cytochrome subunit
MAHVRDGSVKDRAAILEEGNMSQSGSLAALGVLLSAMALQAHAQDTNLGRNLAATCASCHGTNGQVRGDTVKPLAGVAADKIVAMIADYKSGAQPATIMHQIAKGYRDDQIKAIAAFFAAQPAKK